MTIPWTTAWLLAKKLLPVVIDKAPDLIKTFERFRTVPHTPRPTPVDPGLAALQDHINTQLQTIATQDDAIRQLQAALVTTRRSLAIAWTILAAMALLSVAMIAYLYSRP